ncbi:hypothetical protein [Sulfuricurvum sp.]|uniref:hypothetical protein n=1 Tax=Sulfuricurvum sp. TaxID=2025608 RepID=UPI002E36FE22|nr:hypothetical protein [Sulfuricurvum sp.]HEX5330762.1 hypothetical protein [Sulfuricurvum sp.]
MKIIKGEEEAGDCLVIRILLHFSHDKSIPIHDVFAICSEFKNTFSMYYMKNMYGKVNDEVYWQLINLLDLNFAGVLKNYSNEDIRKDSTNEPKVNMAVKNPSLQVESSINEHRLKDIRFSKHERYGSHSLFEIVDSTIIDKIEQFIEDLDELLLVFYDIEEANEEDSCVLMHEGVEILGRFYGLVDTLMVFPVIANSFRNLATFLGDLNADFYRDTARKHLLIENLIGLIKDLEQWMNLIFVQKVAEDVHYLDASFANNVLEIESICNNQQLVLDDEDELEFF